ncbi:prolyl-tRNA synthetase [Thermovibrio ammonificans HB-1]|uniref:Proline--tRNA ligase n=1 Tax=Thermovibrio ammonificans (strain DSM 15698 / JCM 12110 / HB-1) TaxID=648996 RepID=E8T2Q3_THEA1|nr:proline--tRNA ligase [Thermovibrio ammonificans]ADU95978.1 prolyl-tRNA synthetase [Thermovibrio ammonificans HB-1]
MRFSRAFIPTKKESPADAEIPSHKLLVRAGFIRKVASGLYDILPLGARVIRKIEQVIRQEMERAGAQEVILPIMHPAELWQESGRWDVYGKEMIKFKDRHERDYALGPTAEEMITDLVRKEVKSYKELPLNLYQIGRKFRDEIRPRFGLMRSREFIMKDAYSFHASDEDAEREYWNMFETYSRIFKRLGLEFKAVEADTGEIGGSFSHEFMVIADTGESKLVYCPECGYAASTEKAQQVRPEVPPNREGEFEAVEEVHTPGIRRIEEVSRFLSVPQKRILKLLVYVIDGRPVVLALRGDREVEEAKLKKAFNAKEVRLATDKEIEEFTGQPKGYLSPVGLPLPVYADYSVIPMVNFVAGAGRADYHLKNVNWGRDFSVAEFVDVTEVRGGEPCPKCGAPLVEKRGIEVGHIFKLGTKYSEAMGATFVDEQGNEKPMVMGCYGIGVTRVMAAAVEQGHDENGIIWPVEIAPFEVIVIPVNVKKEEIVEAAERVYSELMEAGFDVLLDDRNARPGFKFKDADLIGIPYQVIVGKKASEGVVELKIRRSGERLELPVDGVVGKLRELIGRG